MTARNQIKERKRVKMKNLNANNNECVFVCVQKNYIISMVFIICYVNKEIIPLFKLGFNVP